MPLRLLLVLLLCVGCQQPDPPIPPVPPVQQESPVHGVSIELPGTTVAALHRYLGDTNTVTITSPLEVKQTNITLSLAAGSSFTYNLTDLGGTIVFNEPRPVLTIVELGIPIHPVLERIVLTSPNQAIAHATWLGRDWSNPIPLFADTVGAAAPVPALPIVYMWTGLNCPPCLLAKAAFAEAKKKGTLPFDVIIDPPGVKQINPDPDGAVPHFEWQFGDNAEWMTGWPGLEAFITHWKATKAKVVKGPTKVARLEEQPWQKNKHLSP